MHDVYVRQLTSVSLNVSTILLDSTSANPEICPGRTGLWHRLGLPHGTTYLPTSKGHRLGLPHGIRYLPTRFHEGTRVRALAFNEGHTWDGEECDNEMGKQEDDLYSGLPNILNKADELDGVPKDRGENLTHRQSRRQEKQEKRRFQVGGLWRKLSHTSRDESILPVLTEWVTQGNPLQKNAVIIAISGLKHAKRFQQALEVADWVWKEAPFEINELDHLYRLYFTGEVGSIHDVERCFGEIPSQWQTETVYNQFISCYIAREMIMEAKDIFAKVKESGKPLSASAYNQFMALFRRQHQDDEIFVMLKEMRAAGVAPNTTTFNILLGVKSRHGDVNGMNDLLEEMTALGIPPDVSTYSMMGKAYIKAGLAQKAQALIKELEKKDTQKARLTRELLLSLYAEQGKLDEVEMHWKYMNSFKHLSFHSYGIMIESLGKLGQVSRAEDIAEDAEKKKGILTIRIFNALLDVYSRNGMMQAAEDLVARILQNRLKLNAVSYHHLAAGYLNTGCVNKAVDMVRTSRESVNYYHSIPWLETLFMILETLAHKADTEEAERTFSTFTSAGYYRSTKLYNKLLHVYLKAGKSALGFLDRMAADGIDPDNETLSLLGQIASLTGDD